MRVFLLSIVLSLSGMPALAFERVSDSQEFAQLIEGRVLTRFGIRLEVSTESAEAGLIAGRGFGYPVTGAWRWEAGFFCRDLDWGGSDLGYNCQAVLRDGATVRFVSDRGAGDHADFRLR
ncbi:MAG: dihydrodipicolinate reductase [Pararhodobacter sp.]|nr:dihydrodipicolinate reductase [Pararhodobacter sp.]